MVDKWEIYDKVNLYRVFLFTIVLTHTFVKTKARLRGYITKSFLRRKIM